MWQYLECQSQDLSHLGQGNPQHPIPALSSIEHFLQFFLLLSHFCLDSLLCSLDLPSLSFGTSGAVAFHNDLFSAGLDGTVVGLSSVLQTEHLASLL